MHLTAWLKRIGKDKVSSQETDSTTRNLSDSKLLTICEIMGATVIQIKITVTFILFKLSNFPVIENLIVNCLPIS